MRGPFTTVSRDLLGSSLGECLKAVADCARDIPVQLGLRVYDVRIVVTRWTGGARGLGQEVVARETLILPVPSVEGLEGLDDATTAVGRVEEGGITVRGISGAYTEEELRGHDSAGNPPAPDESVWWEIYYPNPANPTGGTKRRFTVGSVLEYQPTSAQWVVGLVRAHEDRTFSRGDLP